MKRMLSLAWRSWAGAHPRLTLVAPDNHVHTPAPPTPLPLHLQARSLATKQVKGHKKVLKVKPKQDKQEVEIKQRMTVSALAQAMNRDSDHVLEALVNVCVEAGDLGEASELEDRWVQEVVRRSGMKARWAPLAPPKTRQNKDVYRRPPAEPSLLVPRPPVVTILGHVDHGKTTLLDRLRSSQLAQSEAGGITQHIGAFLVELASGERLTVLDTPGHAAFSSLRLRGALVTDIILLLVAADDGVMQQTLESIQHAKNARVPVIVVVSKCDVAQADPQRVLQQLLAHGLACEALGGEVQAVLLSALKGEGLAELAEATVALAEVLELKADVTGPVEAVTIETHTHLGHGPVSTVIVQRGTLRRGCVLVAGPTWGKVRFLFDERGAGVKEAGPSRAVQVVGWRGLPPAGAEVIEVENEQRAREVVEWRAWEAGQGREREEREVIEEQQRQHQEARAREGEGLAHLGWRQRKAALYRANRLTMALRPSEKTQDQGLSLPLVIKGDVEGSLEAILGVLESYGEEQQQQVRMEVVHAGLGDVTENDINMAQAFSGSVYGFNVAVNKSVQQMALRSGVSVRLHRVIYRLVEDLQAQLSSTLPPARTENLIGEASVLTMFEVTVGRRKVLVAGCRVQKGHLDRRMKFRLRRGQEVLWEGVLTGLKHHRDEVQQVKTGMECGLSVDADVLFSPGDDIICYEETHTPQTISWDPGF